MSDSSLETPAWSVSPAQYLRRRQPSHQHTSHRTSRYVAVRDGTRLALDIHLPEPAPQGQTCPVVLAFTPYCRRFALTPEAVAVEPSPGLAQYRDFFPQFGYAFVGVDIRGTGASFGARTGMRSPEERLDYHDIVDWVSHQPWCDGRIGITGISYVGAAADFAACQGHEAIRAVMPVSSVWDTWGDMFYPGGLLYTGMIGGYGRMIEALDLDRRDVLRDFPYFANSAFAGPAPVDEDGSGALLAEALAQHAANFDMTDFISQLGLRGAALRHDPSFTTATIAPKTYLAGMPPRVAHYGVSGWLDGAGYTAGAISRFHALPNSEKRLLLGPWDHGARTHVSPDRDAMKPRFELLAETLRFFDTHVAGLPTGQFQERPVHYYTLIEEAWHEADSFPPHGTTMRSWRLAPGRDLVEGPAALPDGDDAYQVDHSLGTGHHTRYGRIAGQAVESYYPDWHGRDARMIHWTSAALEAAIEVTGTPVAQLWLTSDTPDGAILLYLEDVAPDGQTRYVTEGALRASCRAVTEAPADHPHPGPYHPSTAEMLRPLVPGEPARLDIALHPTSWLFRAGHRVRLALAGADRDHLARVPFGKSPHLRILHGAAHPSDLSLPVVPR